MGPIDIPEEEVRAHVRRIVASGGFVAAGSIRRLLEFTMEKTLSGQSGEIKEFALGVDVFGRKASFDPQSDSIVRVQARKLRERLRAYYESDGVNDLIRIEYPKGSYVPLIRPFAPTETIVLPSIAILPFAKEGSGADDYLCDGICEALTYRLARIPALRVAPWATVLRSRAAHKDHVEAAKHLSVATLLIVSISVQGDTHEVHAEWIDPHCKSHLWGGRYRHELPEFYCIEEEIAADLAERIAPGLGAGSMKPCNWRTTDGRTYQLYLKGRHLWSRRTADGLKKAIQFYQLALEHDPGYAPAFAGIADSYLVLGTCGFLPPAESVPRAKAAALRALEIDRNLGEARTSLATIRAFYEWDWEGADRDYQEAIALSPKYPTARQCYGMCMCARGQLAAGRELMKSALDLDPLSPMMGTQLASGYYMDRKYDEAIQICQSVLEVEPHFWLAEMFMGLCQSHTGQVKDGVNHLKHAVALSGETSVAVSALGHGLVSAGEPEAADQLLLRLQLRARTESISPDLFGLMCCSLGRHEAALAHLERAIDDRPAMLPFWMIDPRFDPIRQTERFQAVLRSMHMI